MVASQQERFLQIGLGLNPGQSMSQTLATQAQSNRQQATMASQAAGQAWAGVGRAAGSALSYYARQPSPVAPADSLAGSPYIDPNTGVV
jgi:hypothetical protein